MSHEKMGTIKDRNGIDLTEAENIKKWQGYTEELYKKDLNGLHSRGVIHLPRARHPGMQS